MQSNGWLGHRRNLKLWEEHWRRTDVIVIINESLTKWNKDGAILIEMGDAS